LPEKQPIPSLTGLRFYAAASVVWAHTVGIFAPAEGLLLDTTRLAYLGMTLFFVLSGFVIHYNYGEAIATLRGPALRRFAVARLARLYPLYLLVLCFDILVVRSRHPFDWSTFANAWPYYVGLMQSWFPWRAGDGYLAVLYVTVAWSISTEVLLYLLYLGIARALSAMATRRAAGIAIACLAIVASVIYFGHAVGWWLTQVEPYWGFYLSPYCRIAEFVLGALTAALYQLRPPTSRRAPFGPSGATLLAGSIAALVVVYALAYHPTLGPAFQELQHSWGFAPGVAGLLFVFATYRTPLSALVENRAVLVLGDASYSLYLMHEYVFGLIRHIDVGAGPALLALRTFVGWGLAALVAIVCYRCYELPARRMVRRALGGERRPAIVAPSLGPVP
jgi:hypothetical protein